MPYYDYRCEECKHEEFDVRRNISEDVSFYTCPECQGRMKQVYKIFGFELKGDGWYKDGYAQKIPPHIKQKDKIDDSSK